jgi:Peptidase M15
MMPRDFAVAIIAYCDATNGSVTSWGRSERHNHAVGGAADSAHRWWLAADVIYDERPDHATARRLAAAYGLHLRRETDHDHLQPADWHPPGEAPGPAIPT